MSEITKVDLLKIDSRLQNKLKGKPVSSDSKVFEEQLLKTVKELETMGNEIDAMMESTSLQKPGISSTGIKPLDQTSKSVVENISAAEKTSVKSAKMVAARYEQMSSKNKS